MIISMDVKMASLMLELVMQPPASAWKDREMGYSRVPSDVSPTDPPTLLILYSTGCGCVFAWASTSETKSLVDVLTCALAFLLKTQWVTLCISRRLHRAFEAFSVFASLYIEA